jgi:arginine decarboxylase
MACNVSAAAAPAVLPFEQLHTPYLSALIAYAQRGPERLHVPGHGGGPGADPALAAALGGSALSLDVSTGLDGIDAGPAPTPFEQAERLAAEAYGAGHSWFLTNGATQGNHAICLALAPAGTGVVVQRNCHGSVVDGLVLSGGSPHYVLPGYDAELGIATVVTPAQLGVTLRERPRARAALLVSPTYFGMVADVAGCAEVAHAAGVPLVVDCAWGPHLGFHPALPASPLQLGADVVLTSTHKHAGSLTQSAMLHVGPGREQLADALGRALRLLTSTSPSALLLASLDAARRQLVVHGARLLGDAIAAAERLRDGIDAIPGCRVLDRSWRGELEAWDPLRVVVDVRETGIRADALAVRLRDVHDVQPEFHTHTAIVFVVPLGLTTASAEHVVGALAEAVEAIEGDDRVRASSQRPWPPLAPPTPRIAPREAFLGRVETVARAVAVGRISADAISAYPPGIPTLLPGEPITAETLEHLGGLRAAGLRLHGAADPELRTLRVAVP